MHSHVADLAFFRTVYSFIGICASSPLYASLILNTGSWSKGQVLFFRTMEKTCLSSVVYGGKPDRIVLIYVPPLKANLAS